MGSCFSTDQASQELKKKDQKPAEQGYAKPAQDRVDETDKAIFDLKVRMNKVKTYIKKLETNEQEATDKCKELMKAGNKQRAIIFLKKKKLCAKECEKAQNANILLQETLMNVESAAADVNVMKALQTGDQVLKELHKQVSMEDWEEMYENHEDNKARADQEMELFGEALNDADLEAELNGLVELNAAAEMGELGPQANIPQQQVPVQQQQVPVQAQAEPEEERQLEYA